MEYIEKINNTYFARTGEVKIDNVNYFDSRVNYDGWGGRAVIVPVGDFKLQWLSNFNYGTLSSGSCVVAFRDVEVAYHGKVYTTQEFVYLLNKYATLNSFQKDDIMAELANALAHITVELNRDVHYINQSNFVHPRIKINDLNYYKPRHDIEKIRTIVDENNSLKKEVAALQSKLDQILSIVSPEKIETETVK